MAGKRPIVVALLALTLLLVPPASALAADEEFEGASAAFSLQGSHGYEITVIALSDHVDGRGELLLFANGPRGGVFYRSTDAIVTVDGIESDLGGLGRIDLDFVPTGVRKKYRPKCGEGDISTYEKASYRGTFEFRGEEGFTRAEATRIPFDPRPFAELICVETVPWTHGSDFAGAHLRVLPRHGERSRLDFEAAKVRPGGRTRLEVSLREERHGLEIVRATEIVAGVAAFDYDRTLRTATVDPPAPFSGSATYRRHALPANRWVGDLSVDLPGRADVPLVRPGLGANLAQGA